MKNIRKDLNKEDAHESKPFFDGFMDFAETEIMNLLEMVKERVDVPKYERKGQGLEFGFITFRFEFE